jgi:hypothetical protein
MKSTPWKNRVGERIVSRKAALLHLAILLTAMAMPTSRGQTYSITWDSLDGGGGASTGGGYTVAGTIGQPDAGTMSGANYTLNGGFWGIVAAVQTPDAPTLAITLITTNSVVVSWALPADGWVLEWTNRVTTASAPWTQVSPPYQGNTTQSWIIVSPPSGNQFYRLHKP